MSGETRQATGGRLKQLIADGIVKLIVTVLAAGIVAYVGSYLGGREALSEVQRDVRDLKDWRDKIEVRHNLEDQSNIERAALQAKILERLNNVAKNQIKIMTQLGISPAEYEPIK